MSRRAPQPTSLDVLLVEDQAADARLTERALRRSESEVGLRFAVTGVGSLAEALQATGESRFDLVLLDLGLPDASGAATISRLASRRPGLPIVVLTAERDEDLGAEAMRRGAQDYLAKGPAGWESVGRTIRYALERSRLAAQGAQVQRAEWIEALAASLAHDINTPLCCILGNLDYAVDSLRDDGAPSVPGGTNGAPPPPDLARALEEARESAQQVRASMEALRGLAGPGSAAPERTDLRAALDQALALVELRRGRLKAATAHAQALPPVRVDAGRLARGVASLLVRLLDSEAVTPVDGGPHVRVRTASEGSGSVVAELEVPGRVLPLDFRGRPVLAFHPGRRWDEGGGLDLFLLHTVASEAGGGVEVLEAGGTVRLRLPEAADGD